MASLVTVTQHKACRGCGRYLPVENFHSNGGGKLRPRCADCRNAQSRTYYKTNRKRVRQTQYLRAHHLRRKFGISIEDYDQMLAEQEGGCAICGTRTPDGNARRFHVDHDHDTGQIRGLLCHSCNTGIGKLRDDPELLRAAVEYLERGRFS